MIEKWTKPSPVCRESQEVLLTQYRQTRSSCQSHESSHVLSNKDINNECETVFRKQTTCSAAITMCFFRTEIDCSQVYIEQLVKQKMEHPSVDKETLFRHMTSKAKRSKSEHVELKVSILSEIF